MPRAIEASQTPPLLRVSCSNFFSSSGESSPSTAWHQMRVFAFDLNPTAISSPFAGSGLFADDLSRALFEGLDVVRDLIGSLPSRCSNCGIGMYSRMEFSFAACDGWDFPGVPSAEFAGWGRKICRASSRSDPSRSRRASISSPVASSSTLVEINGWTERSHCPRRAIKPCRATSARSWVPDSCAAGGQLFERFIGNMFGPRLDELLPGRHSFSSSGIRPWITSGLSLARPGTETDRAGGRGRIRQLHLGRLRMTAVDQNCLVSVPGSSAVARCLSLLLIQSQAKFVVGEAVLRPMFESLLQLLAPAAAKSPASCSLMLSATMASESWPARLQWAMTPAMFFRNSAGIPGRCSAITSRCCAYGLRPPPAASRREASSGQCRPARSSQ